MTTRFSYYGIVEVVLGAGLQRFHTPFARELVPAGPSPADARLVVGLDNPRPALHHPPSTFGSTGALDEDGRFACGDGRGHWCRVDFDTVAVDRGCEVHLSLCCSDFSASVLLEWLLIPLAHFALAAHGYVPLHASGVVESGGRAVVFSAWQGVGKTNLVLGAQANGISGAYLGDDMVLVHETGDGLTSSRTISAYGYNRRFLSGLGPRASLRLRAGDVARRAVHRYPQTFGRLGDPLLAVANMGSNVRLENERARRVEDIVRHRVENHVRCRSVAGGESPELRPAPVPDAAAASNGHLAVLDFEHTAFQRFVQAWRWATTASRDPWAELRTAWRPLLESYFRRVARYYDLTLPRSADPVDATRTIWQALSVLERRA